MNSSILKIYLLITAMVFATSCTPPSASLQANAAVSKQKEIARIERKPINYFNTFWVASPLKISPYLKCVFQDKAGNFWFGTDGYGVCRYNGMDYRYFTTEHGLGDNHVRAIREDSEGLWFTTNVGECRYNGFSFVNFPGKGRGKNDGC